MTEPKYQSRVEPSKSLLQGKPYTPSHASDVRDTWAKWRQEQEAKKEKQ